jgi:hypothetical protein
MNAENMNDDIMNIDVAVMSLYVDIHIYVIYTLIGMVRLALIFISTIFVMVGYMCSNCSVWVDKLLICISASINITHAITSINFNRNFASLDDINEINNNLFNNGIPINVNATYIKREPNSDDESDDDDIDGDNDDDDIDGDNDDDDDGDDDDESDELANLSELIPIKDETSHADSDEYADLPELIPIKDEVIDEYADLPDLIPIDDDIGGDENSDEYADLPDLIPIIDEELDESLHVADNKVYNKVYIDDDIQDVTDQYLAKKEANKVIVDLTDDDDKNTSIDNDKNTAESI